MTIALMFSAIYSTYHNGLVAYAGSLTNGQYFLFEFVPHLPEHLLRQSRPRLQKCFGGVLAYGHSSVRFPEHQHWAYHQ
jgi:hypothetical protein